MNQVWTHPTALDVYTTWTSATCVRLVPLNHNGKPPFIPKIVTDAEVGQFAGFVLSLDAVDRLNAYSSFDFSGDFYSSCQHVAFATLRQNKAYDVERELSRFIEGKVALLPDLATPGEFRGEISPWGKVPRGTVDALLPEMQRAPSGRYSQDATVRRGLLLNQARAVQQARSAAIDAGLAATSAANWATARAAELAQAQAMYPDRGYT